MRSKVFCVIPTTVFLVSLTGSQAMAQAVPDASRAEGGTVGAVNKESPHG